MARPDKANKASRRFAPTSFAENSKHRPGLENQAGWCLRETGEEISC